MSDVCSIETTRLRQLKYILLSGQVIKKEFARHHDSAYRLWRRVWLQTFEELNSKAVLRADDFTRQDIISALFHRDQAVGLVLHSYFNLSLEAARDHTYLSTYPEPIVAKLREEGKAEILSMEYLTLDPAWRGSRAGAPLAEIIVGLTAKISEACGLKSAIAVTRNEKNVNEILYGYGAHCLARNLTKHNVAVDLVCFDRENIHPAGNPAVNEWVEFFWSRRVDARETWANPLLDVVRAA